MITERTEHTLTGFTTVGLIIGMIMLSANIPAPLYSAYANRFHFGPATLTMIFATYVVFLIPSLLFWGQWSDFKGRHLPIGGGILLAILGAVSFLVARGILALFLARALQGLAAGMLSGPATAMLTELDPSKQKAPLLAGIATVGGTATGPLLGGVIAEFAPWPLHLVYALSLAGLVGSGLAFRLVPETRMRQTGTFYWHRPRVPVEIRRVFWLAGGTAFVVWSVTAFFMSLAPTYAETLLHVTNLAVAGGVVFLMLVSAFATQLITRSSRPDKLMVTGLALTFMALVILLLTVPSQNLILLVASTVLAGIGQGMAFLGSQTTITQAAPNAVKADVISSFYVIIYAGVGAPIILVGLAAQQFGLYQAMMAYTVFVGILVIGFGSGLLRHHKGRQSTLLVQTPKRGTRP